MKQQYANLLMIVFTALLALGTVVLYYAPIKVVSEKGHVSNLHGRVENLLFDIRTRISPAITDTSQFATVAIDDETIAKLNPGSQELSWTQLLKITRVALKQKPKQVVVLLYPQVFSYEDEHLQRLAKLAERHEELIIGVFNIATTAEDINTVPDPLKPILDQVGAAELNRYFRTQVIRNLQLADKAGLPTIHSLVYNRTDPEEDLPKEIVLNYFNPYKISPIKAEHLLSNAGQEKSLLRDKVVLIGYSAYRKYTRNHREATFANSPWQADGDDLGEGAPLLNIHTIAMANLLQGTHLKEASTAFVIGHALIISLISIVIWRLSVGFASFLFIGGWAVLLVLHSWLFALFSFYIPLADTVLFSSFGTIAGALIRLSHEARIKAAKEAQMSAEKELAAIQDHFLNRFSFKLSKINTEVKTILLRQSQLRSGSGTLHEAYTKALGSSEELEDYLTGIQQFAAIEGAKLKTAGRTQFDLVRLTHKVVKQFESRIHEAGLKLHFSGLSENMAHSDVTLTGQILFNLISNAIKYSPHGESVTIHFAAREDKAIITVSDHGPGIAKDLQDRIYEKFYRVKNDDVYRVKGHGLGLYLSSYFATIIGAEIQLESHPGKGSAFSLLLPYGRKG